YGGEEFVVLLPSTTLEQAKAFAEKCRKQIIEQNIEHNYTQIDSLNCVSISLGVSSMVPSVSDSPSSLIKQADLQLYLAKSNGRNRVE
ncbi:MAG: GGDEF domain-containing protein, partial [Colwellia sp.]|nr:GGDEF domain-containing protein [Colwellia sp.]